MEQGIAVASRGGGGDAESAMTEAEPTPPSMEQAIAVASRGGGGDAESAMMEAEAWSSVIPADLLGRIASHLDDATDLVRFRCVCKAWRSGAWLPVSSLLPWLLSPRYGDDRKLHFRLTFSGTTLHLPCPSTLNIQSVIIPTSSLATRGRLFVTGPTNGDRHDACLLNPLNGASTLLPKLPSHLCISEATCSVTADGSTMVVCTCPPCSSRRTSIVLANILRQEQAGRRWMDLAVYWPALRSNSVLPSPKFYALYHRGCIICGDEEVTCVSVLPLPGVGTYDTDMAAVWVRPPPLPPGKVACSTFVLESRDELLWARVLTPTRMLDQNHCPVVSNDDPSSYLCVSVHQLQMPAPGEQRDQLCWVNKDRDIRDQALFLSPRSSFAMEGVGAAGSGCAYFLCERPNSAAEEEPLCGVYRYDFNCGIACLVEELPPGWNTNSVWFATQPIE